MSAAPMIAIDGLTKRFVVPRPWGELVRAPFRRRVTTAVDGVSFEVGAREIFGLLGQNGAGKTTLFKMLSTLVLPDAGTARIDGHDVRTEAAAVRRRIAPVIANERSLHWRLTATENLRIYAALQGLGAGARAEIARVLAVTGLERTGAALVGSFSSGMRQRLLIARALLGRPRVLLLDEPTRSLDPLSAREFRQFLRATVAGSEGCTVLLATHDADEVWELCDRVGVLERGTLLEVDATARLRARVAQPRYTAWVRADVAEAVRADAEAAGLALRPVAGADAGWQALECLVPGAAEEAAAALAVLTRRHAVARFERHAPDLAEVLEGVLRTRAPGGPRA